jgi:hypothetical protein
MTAAVMAIACLLLVLWASGEHDPGTTVRSHGASTSRTP